jgi:hypothetical protein
MRIAEYRRAQEVLSISPVLFLPLMVYRSVYRLLVLNIKPLAGFGCPGAQVPLKWVNCFVRTRFLRIALRVDQADRWWKKGVASAAPLSRFSEQLPRSIVVSKYAIVRLSVLRLPALSWRMNHEYFLRRNYFINRSRLRRLRLKSTSLARFGSTIDEPIGSFMSTQCF